MWGEVVVSGWTRYLTLSSLLARQGDNEDMLINAGISESYHYGLLLRLCGLNEKKIHK